MSARVNGPDLSSKPLRLLVTGAGGVLGGRLAALLAEVMDVVAAVHRAAAPPGLPTVALDLLDAGSLERALSASRADAVLHAAAMAEPDACERDPERARAINTEAPARLAAACAARGLRLLALSTDLVFPGTRAFSSEDHAPLPLLHYGRTKLEGERALLAAHPGAAVARITLAIGRGHGARGTASEAIAWALAAGRRLRLYTDQYRTPLDAESLAAAAAALLRGAASGIVHLAGAERVSRYELGLRVARAFGLDAGLIEPVSQRDHPPAAPRPIDVSLDISRARRLIGFAPRALDAAVAEGRPRPPLL